MSVFVWTIPPAVTPTPISDVVAGALDHAALAIARLRSQFRGKQAMEDMLACWISEVQPVEDALVQLRDGRSIDTATGATLSLLGKIVGEIRDGQADDDYRRLVRARVAINRSSGVAEDVLTVARALLNDDGARIALRNYGLGGATLTIHDVAVPSDLADLIAAGIRAAVAAGIRIDVLSSVEEHSTVLHFDSATKTLDLTTFADAH